LLFNVNSAIFQLYHDKNKLIFNEIMMRFAKNKDWLDQNKDNVSEWGDMSIRGLLFQLANTKNPTPPVG
jgi:hypothetical protein